LWCAAIDEFSRQKGKLDKTRRAPSCENGARLTPPRSSCMVIHNQKKIQRKRDIKMYLRIHKSTVRNDSSVACSIPDQQSGYQIICRRSVWSHRPNTQNQHCVGLLYFCTLRNIEEFRPLDTTSCNRWGLPGILCRDTLAECRPPRHCTSSVERFIK